MERPTRIPVPSQPTSPRRKVVLSPFRSVSPANKQILNSPTTLKSDKPEKNVGSSQGDESSVASESLMQLESTSISPGNIIVDSAKRRNPLQIATGTPFSAIPTTTTLVPEAKSVTYVSPTHPLYSIVDSESCTLNSSFLSPVHKYEHPTNPLHYVCSVTNEELQTTSSTDILSGSISPTGTVPSIESPITTYSDISISSRRSQPVPMRSENVTCSLGEEIIAADYIDGGFKNLPQEMAGSSSMPELPIVSARLHLIKLKNVGEVTAGSTESSLPKSGCKTRERKDMKNQERALQELQQSMLSLKHSHAEELAELKQIMRKDMEIERQRLLNQIREQTKMKEEVSAKAYSLGENIDKESVAETLGEQVLTPGNINELEALKVELNALRDLQQETEHSHSLLVQRIEDQEKVIKALQAEKDNLKVEVRRKARSSDDDIEASLLKINLEAAEARIAELEQERVTVVIEKIIEEAIKAKVENDKHLELELKSYKSRSTNSLTQENLTNGWNVLKDGSKNHIEEMQPIIESLESEGYGPSQVTTVDAIKHLWCKNERSQKQLARMQESLAQAIGKKKHDLVEEYEQQRIDMEKKLKDVHLQMAATEKVAQSNLELIKKKLKELLLEQQVTDDKHKSLQHKQVVLSKENQALKSKLTDLRVEMASKSPQIAGLEADSKSGPYQPCLAAEKHQNSMLKAKLETLTSQLATKQKEFARIQGAPEIQVQSSPNSKTVQEITEMRAKIGELQGEIRVQKQQLSQITAQRDSLKEKIDTHSVQIATLESQLSREKTNSDHMKLKLTKVSSDLHSKNQELEEISAKKRELELEVTSIKKDLQAAQQNFSTLEAELAAVQADYDRCCEELSNSKITSVELEKQFLSVSADATFCEETVDSLQASLEAKEAKLENAQVNLESEKHTNKELRSSVDKLSGNLDRTSKRLECMGNENSLLKKDLAKKKQDFQHLQQEAHSMRLELKESQAKTSALQSETGRLQQEIKSHTKELAKCKDTVSALRQRLTDTNRELTTAKQEVEHVKSQLSSSEAEKMRLFKTKDNLQSDIQELKARLLAQSNTLTEKNHWLSKKEEEFRTIAQERVILTAEISGLKREIQNLMSARSKVENGLSLKGSELDAETKKLKECQHHLEKKCEELRKTKLEVESMQCSLDCVSEKYSTLQLVSSSTKAELQDALEQYDKQSAELRQIEEDHHTEIKSLKEYVQQVEDQLTQYRTKSVNLESQLTTSILEKERLTAEAEDNKQELTSMVSMLQSKLATSEQGKLLLESKLAEQSQQMQTAKSSLNEQIMEKISQMEKLQTDLSIAQTQIKHLNKDMEEFQRQLEEERVKRVYLQDELDEQVSTINTVTTQMSEIEHQLNAERERVESLTSELLNSELKGQQLSKELRETQEHLYNAEESAEETRIALTETLMSVKASHKQEQLSLQLENEQLSKELISTKENLVVTKDQLQTCEESLTVTNDCLTQMELKCNQLESILTTESRDNKTLENDLSQLQSTYSEARMQIADLSEKLLIQSTIAEQLKVEIQSSNNECESLQGQIQMQRETAAASLNRIQKHSQEKCAELHAKIQEHIEKLKEAHTSTRALQHDIVGLKADNAQLESALLDEKQECAQLTTRLNSETTSLKLSEQRMEQLERISNTEQKSKAKVETHLEEEISQRRRVEQDLDGQRQQLMINAQELAKARAMLVNESSKNGKLKEDLMVAKAEIKSLNQNLSRVSGAVREFKAKSEQELQSLREKYLNDKKLLKEKVKELQKNLQVLSGQHECRGEEVSRLQASNQTLLKEQKELTKQLSDKEYELQAKKDDCRNLRTKVLSLETQIKQLDREMSMLGEAQAQYELYKKRVEQQSRDEAQRVLSEVTSHMEQQHTAHKYLESLRLENEKILLKEKGREINQLKAELTHRKQEIKQDKMRVQHLEVEAKHLKTQRKDQERSRRRLEARLEQVNDTLSRTLPVSQFSDSYRSSRPMHSSTPVFKRSGN